MSRARPKIADYPFTTLVPNLGVVPYKDGTSFVMADIPGIIEGAAEGAGLGHQFLRHVERCRVLIHLVDLTAPGEDRAPVRDLDVLDHELARYSPELARKPQIIAANKIDLPEARERIPAFRAAMSARGLPVFPISAATGEGLGPLLDAVAQVLSGGALPTLGRAERPRRRPKAGAAASDRGGSALRPAHARGDEHARSMPAPRGSHGTASGTMSRKERASPATTARPTSKRKAPPPKKSTVRKGASRSPLKGGAAARPRGGARKRIARSSRPPAGKGAR